MKLGEIKLSLIDKGERYRKDYGDLTPFIKSIRDNGLINPIAISEHPTVDGTYLLCAGGRRLSCFEAMGRETIPCRIYDHILSDLELRLIESEENFQRKDMGPVEEANLIAEIHRLKIELYGEKTSTSPDASGYSMRDTANDLGVSHAKISQDIKFANAVKMFPDVDFNNCKNRNEAQKLLDKMTSTIIRKDMADKFEKDIRGSGGSEGKRKKLIDSYIIGDFFTGVKQIPDGSINLVEIDPPYAINIGKVKKKDGNISQYDFGSDGYNEIDKDDYESFMRPVFKECFRVMSSNSWLICWFGPDPWFEYIGQWLRSAGFETTRLVGQWVKGEEDDSGFIEATSGQAHQPTRRLANANEMFYYAWKGQPVLGKPGSTNIFGHKPVPPKSKIHPTERPLPLIVDILETFGMEGQRVLVPFAGSGQTLIASAKLSMLPIGFDISGSFKDGYILKVQENF